MSMRVRKKKDAGQGTTELALLLPILFGLFLGAVQLIIFLQSLTMTQYASFMAARSFQVYGDRTLDSIGYQKISSPPYTNEGQSIVEATAEAILFESLMWEQKRVKILDPANYLHRVYQDANNTTYGSNQMETSTGAVHVNFLCSGENCEEGSGVDVTYCMPIVFPGIAFFFEAAKKDYPCKITQDGQTYSGVMVSHRTQFGREPVEK